MQTRRDFVKIVGSGALVLGIGEVSMGLSCASVFTDIERYVPIGLSAFQAVVSIVDPALVVPVALVVTEVKAAFADLVAAVTMYNDAPAANKATLLGKISTAINVVETEIQIFWNDLKLPDSALANEISSLLGVILSTLTAFLPQLPAPTTPVAMVQKRPSKVDQLQKTIVFTPKKRSVKQFKHDFNTVLESNQHVQYSI